MNRYFANYVALLSDLHQHMSNAISGLTTEALDWMPGADMNSLCVLVVHVTGATRFWVGDVVMGEASGRDRAAEFTANGWDAAALQKRLDDTLAYVRGACERLTLADLERVTDKEWRGQPVTVDWALGHALEHMGLHLGHAQITRQLWDQRQQ